MTERAVRELIVQGSSQLEAAHVPSPRVDAELLMAHTLGVERSQLIVQSSLSDEQVAEYMRLISRRSAREPLQHLTGRAYFRHLELEVGPGVFIPRPETETLLSPDHAPGIVEPTILHRVEPIGTVTFHVEFFRAPTN